MPKSYKREPPPQVLIGIIASDVLNKVKEEIAELEVEIEADNSLAMEEELGDLLFSCVNLSRHLGIDPERAMRAANNKFQRRFEAMEILASDKNPSRIFSDVDR